MSVWSYVNATFDVNKCFEHDIYEIFGKECLWEDGIEAFRQKKGHEDEYLPCGSEGTLEYRKMHSTLIEIGGSLRDWDSDRLIDDWFTSCCKKLQQLGYKVKAKCNFECYPVCYTLEFKGEPW